MEVMSLPRAAGTVRLSPRLLAPLPDTRLVEEIRRGNEPAFEVVYDRHHRGLLSFCRHMLGSQEESEDAVQQTFVSAYRDILASDKPIQLKPWLYTIARNRCLSMLRARREEAAEIADIPTAGLSDAVVERDEVRRLVADVQKLPADQRAALVLSELGDLSHSDIATIIGCETVHVKALVFQARSSLIASKQAADVPCHEIRAEISTARGAALRRGVLRRHMKACPACSAFRDEVRRQRQLLALALPVVPTAALKSSILGAIGAGKVTAGGLAAGGALAGGAGSGAVATGGAAAGGAGVAGAAGAGGGLVAGLGALGGAKLAVIAAVAAGIAGGGVALDELAISNPDGGATGSTATSFGGTAASPAGSAFSGGIVRAFGARLGSGFTAEVRRAAAAAAADGAGWSMGKAFGSTVAKGHGSGRGNGGGNGHSKANGGNGGSGSLQMQPGGNGNGNGNSGGNGNGNGGGANSGSSSGGNGGGHAYGHTGGGGSGNGNAYGQGSGTSYSSGISSTPAPTYSHAPQGNAYGTSSGSTSTGSSGITGGGGGNHYGQSKNGGG